MYLEPLRRGAVGVVLLVSACTGQQDGVDLAGGGVAVAPDEDAAGRQTGEEAAGEAQEELTRWELCYKITYTATKLACGRTHTPPDVCHHIADAAATRACRRFLIDGSVEEFG